MKITYIEKQKNNSNRYNIFVDGNYCFSAELEDIIKYQIDIDRIFSKEELEKIIEKCEISKGFKYGLNLLSNKDYTKSEMFDKLKEKGYSDNSIEVILDKLCEYGFVDDMKYAEKFAYRKVKLNKIGKKRIINDLKNKGIEAEILDKIQFDEEEILNNAYALLIKKLKGNKKDKESLQKAIRYLYNKGYTFEEIKKAVFKINNEIDWE
ncbi:regulatory protein RecX [Thermobrachium celere]|uniref:Regulatory protein RecX n=1 Tax=Thermobrachium celere DSM 8682 TaxID=941824 RepID=R7RRQ8_9CLOT|nr:RecX family transcriptional regulator [Thermobrachium celere]CDF57968.1 regulatory protein RecX [Thermobrachium celere DSM 8682]